MTKRQRTVFLVFTASGVTETSTYDCFNRLTGFSKTGTTASYTYKPNGLRLSKTVNGTKTTHVWDGSNIVLELNASNVVVDKYVRGINLIKSNNSGYFMFNAHGDVTLLVPTSGGAPTKVYSYDAFGVEVNKSDTDNNPWRYCGEYYDKESDTIYLRARYYSPRLGRFTQQDGWGYQKDIDPLSLNLYTYCKNNPVLYLDPTGHFADFNGIINGVTSFVGGAVDLAVDVTVGTIEFAQGVTNGMLETFTWGISECIVYEKDGVPYLVGKVVGNTISGVITATGTLASGALTFVSAGSLVAIPATSATAAATATCAVTTVKAATNAANNINKIISNNSNSGSGPTWAPKSDVSIEKQLQGKGQLKDLRNNPNLEKGVNINELIKKTPEQLEKMNKSGEISDKTLKQIKKAFEGRDLGK